MNNFTDTLRKHQLKATPQRLAILNSIKQYGHINIDSLYKEIKQLFPSISLATIYKNINAMKDTTLLQEVNLPSYKSVYEISKKEHSHLLCIKCQHIEDINLNLDIPISIASNNSNFTVQQTDLILSGICTNCT